jgi:hypothetical protein
VTPTDKRGIGAGPRFASLNAHLANRSLASDLSRRESSASATTAFTAIQTANPILIAIAQPPPFPTRMRPKWFHAYSHVGVFIIGFRQASGETASTLR